jgi:hypothetical protein
MKTQTYILQKDIPGSGIGTKFIWNDSMKGYYQDGNVIASSFTKDLVENNPEWFLPEEENITWKYVENLYHRTTPPGTLIFDWLEKTFKAPERL